MNTDFYPEINLFHIAHDEVNHTMYFRYISDEEDISDEENGQMLNRSPGIRG